ncbi:MAG: hypothetical protein E7487_11465 [Ruminococcaceae bacterium]|nr:hypothetical protein [Oscillospiraceae bacterium]
MENYGFFKYLATENPYVSLAKTLNSIKTTAEIQKTLKRITKKNICYAHMGQLVIKDGVCYASFIQNPGSDGEDHDSTTSGVVLAVFELEKIQSDSFDPEIDIAFYPVGSKGDICAGYTAASIFKDNSMCLVGDLLYICFSFITDDNKSHIFQKTFNIKTNTWVNEALVKLRYKEKNYDFSDETINRIYRDSNVEPRAKGLIELVSAWSKYNGEYYATGLTIEAPNHGLIVKTRDFCTMDFVDVIPFNDMGTAEIASYIYKDKLYVACRQNYGIPYLYMGSLNLKTMTWNPYHKIADGNARPWFFEYKNELYLLNTTQELHRQYTNISRVRTWDTPYQFFNDYCPTEIVATIKGCGSYYATANYGDDIYFVSTHNTESFGKLCLHFYDEDEVNNKLLSLFE